MLLRTFFVASFSFLQSEGLSAPVDGFDGELAGNHAVEAKCHRAVNRLLACPALSIEPFAAVKTLASCLSLRLLSAYNVTFSGTLPAQLGQNSLSVLHEERDGQLMSCHWWRG